MQKDTITMLDTRYDIQQAAINEIADKLGVVAYRPSYHGTKGDKNTVLFYSKQDEEHNRMVDLQPVHYSRSEALDRGIVNGDCVYRDHFWSFENSDANGQLDMDWANYGKLDLGGADWATRLEGQIAFRFCRKQQTAYIVAAGGYLGLREADEVYNGFNREQLRALKMMHGRLWLGSINFHDDRRKKVAAGEESVYEELLDQKVHNFSCEFAVPAPDKELEEMIRAWNKSDSPRKAAEFEAMMDRVEQLGGINLLWY